MSLTVCLGAYSLRFSKAGAYRSMFLNWALGLKANGINVIWLDSVLKSFSSEYKNEIISELKKELLLYGIENLSVINNDGTDIEIDQFAYPIRNIDSIDLFINLGYDLPQFFVNRFKKNVFIDIDPGLTQIWMAAGDLKVAKHDYYFTYGENVNHSELIPGCNIQWIYTPPAISIPLWKIPKNNDPDSPYTTVSNWWNPNWFILNDESFDNSKRSAFLKFKSIPLKVQSKIELSAHFSDTKFDKMDRSLLEKNGWKVKHVLETSTSVEEFRKYICYSRGEFSCLSPAYTKLQTAWTSERTLNYLASGRPAIITNTGPSKFLPNDEGLFRFSSMKQAVKCFAKVESDYEKHSNCAIKLIEEYFDAKKVVANLLEYCLN